MTNLLTIVAAGAGAYIATNLDNFEERGVEPEERGGEPIFDLPSLGLPETL